MDVELCVGPCDAVWQRVTFANEDEARDFINLMCCAGYDCRPAGRVHYRHDYGPVMC